LRVNYLRAKKLPVKYSMTYQSETCFMGVEKGGGREEEKKRRAF